MSMSGREKREQLLAMAEEVKAKYVEEGESNGSLYPVPIRPDWQIGSLFTNRDECNRLIDDHRQIDETRDGLYPRCNGAEC
jgi:hypothetical protein